MHWWRHVRTSQHSINSTLESRVHFLEFVEVYVEVGILRVEHRPHRSAVQWTNDRVEADLEFAARPRAKINGPSYALIGFMCNLPYEVGRILNSNVGVLRSTDTCSCIRLSLHAVTML